VTELITDDYQKQLQTMHAGRTGKKWGTTGSRNGGYEIVRFLRHRNIETLLDYGAGQGTLSDYIHSELPDIKITQYDPGIPEKQHLPRGNWDAIVSTDVLEHVEPEKIDDTIKWMAAHANKAQYHHIACCECGLFLPDGRNAHISVFPPKRWKSLFMRPGWETQYYAHIEQRKRGMVRTACQIGLDRVG
jgi:hypothetical protein